MDVARWRRIQDLFHHAVTLPGAEQRPFLHDTCGDDEELISEVLAMLEQDADGNSLLDHGVAELAQRTLTVPALLSKEFGGTVSSACWAKAAWEWSISPSAKLSATK